jgi:hypothetical protein
LCFTRNARQFGPCSLCSEIQKPPNESGRGQASRRCRFRMSFVFTVHRTTHPSPAELSIGQNTTGVVSGLTGSSVFRANSQGAMSPDALGFNCEILFVESGCGGFFTRSSVLPLSLRNLLCSILLLVATARSSR